VSKFVFVHVQQSLYLHYHVGAMLVFRMLCRITQSSKAQLVMWRCWQGR